MSSFDIISMSLRNLFKRKLRTFLTVLGVIIGTTAIVVMISMGIAVNEGFTESLSEMGDIRVLTVRNPSSGGSYYASGRGVTVVSGGSSGSSTEKITLNDKAVESLKKIPKVTAVTPVVQIDMTATSGKYTTWLSIKGIDFTTMQDFEYRVAEGELLKGDKNGIVFGNGVPMEFYNPNDRNYWRNYDWSSRTASVNVLTDKIEMSYEEGYGYNYETPFNDVAEENTKQKPKPYKLTVNGVLESMGYETDYYAFMDIEEVQKIKLAQQKYRQNEGINYYGGSKFSATEFDTVLVKCNTIDDVETVMAEIEAQGFYVDSYYIEVLKQMQEVSRGLQIFLGAIGAVSMFVAAIGITNTMIMSIYERTREIGIMKVVGASIKDIKKLFLLEAALIGFIGGAIGIAVSLGVSVVLNKVGGSIIGNLGGMGSKVSAVPVWLCLAALIFASAIGLVSGYFPARRAMKLSALEAIRSE